MASYEVFRELVDTAGNKYVVVLTMRGRRGEVNIKRAGLPKTLAECHFEIEGRGSKSTTAIISTARLGEGAPLGLRGAMLTFLEEVGLREEKIRRIEVRDVFTKAFLVNRGFKFLGSHSQRRMALLEKAKERDIKALEERGVVRDTVSEAKKSIEYIKKEKPFRKNIEFIKPVTELAQKKGIAESKLHGGWAWKGAIKRRRLHRY